MKKDKKKPKMKEMKDMACGMIPKVKEMIKKKK